MSLLLDKLGERLAFERIGTRLYDALMVKCRAVGESRIPERELKQIREDEARHLALVGATMLALGGDPAVPTPSGRTASMEVSGLVQVVTDPHTTVPQALHAVLIAELADGAAWDELIELSDEADNHELVRRFSQVRDTESVHLEKVRGWYKAASKSAVAA